MRDLSGPLSRLVPSSQEGGNLIQADLAETTMTAPGSEPVSPLPPALFGSHPEPDAVQHARTVLVGADGQKYDATPAQDGDHAFQRAGGYEGDSGGFGRV